MAETKPIPVRLGDDIIKRLDAAAERIGNNRAGLIRLLVGTWLVEFEKYGEASMPPNWREIMAAMDNRTSASRAELTDKTPHHGSNSKQTDERSNRAKHHARDILEKRHQDKKA